VLPIEGVTIFARWVQAGMPLINIFAPYAFHCLSVDALFLNGLACGLITTRPTNNLDKEYLYYLPFCNVFTSNDKFHWNIAPLFLRSDQKFIVGGDLKKDLKGIVEHIEKLDDDQRKKMLKAPPIIEESITFNLWQEYFDYPNDSRWRDDATELDHDYVLKKMQEFSRAMEGDNVQLASGDEEFIVRKSYLSMNDPCPICGSGKRVVDCCIPMEEFMKLAIKPELEESYNKADHVRFMTLVGERLPAVVFVYDKGGIETKGHLGLINHYKHEELKLTGTIENNKIRLSFIEVATGETMINLKPLPFNASQVEIFVKNGYDRIAILWGLVNPKDRNGVIIPIPDDGTPPSQLVIKGFDLMN
jgi:hypothetical protein